MSVCALLIFSFLAVDRCVRKSRAQSSHILLATVNSPIKRRLSGVFFNKLITYPLPCSDEFVRAGMETEIMHMTRLQLDITGITFRTVANDSHGFTLRLIGVYFAASRL